MSNCAQSIPAFDELLWISCGVISIDGAGATRFNGKGYKGSCVVENAIDRVTSLPLDVMTSQV